MAACLLDFALEAAAEDLRSDNARRIGRVVRSWRRHKQGIEQEETYRIRDIYNVDRMVNDQWVSVKWRLVPPSIEFLSE